MRFCFVNMPIEYYSPVSGGAISTIIGAVSAELRAAGHTVHIVSCTDVRNPPAEPIVSMGDFRDRTFTRKVIARLRPGAQDGYRRDVTAALSRLPEPVDVVIVFNDYASPQWIAAEVGEAKVGVWLQNDEPVPHSVNWDRIGFVLACSDYIRDRAIERGAPSGLCRTAASGVDASAFRPRADWLQPPKPLRVLCMGRLDSNKGHDVGVAAVAALRREGLSVEVSLAGAKWWYGGARDSYVDSLLRSVADAGGRYLGLVSRDRMPDVVAEHDVCMVLSRSAEPFGLVVLEAMAAGLAVIASDRGGLPQACGDAAVALLDPDDAGAVVAALRSVAGSAASDRLAAAKRASRARAEAASWTVTAAALVAATAEPR